jgi:hypothetical protein
LSGKFSKSLSELYLKIKLVYPDKFGAVLPLMNSAMSSKELILGIFLVFKDFLTFLLRPAYCCVIL